MPAKHALNQTHGALLPLFYIDEHSLEMAVFMYMAMHTSILDTLLMVFSTQHSEVII